VLIERHCRLGVEGVERGELGVQFDQALHRTPTQPCSLLYRERPVVAVGDRCDRGFEHPVRGEACVGEARVVGVDDVIAEHHLAMCPMFGRDSDIAATDRGEPLDRIVDHGTGADELIVQGLEPFDRDRGEQPADVTEVVAGRGVGHTGPAGDLAQTEPVQAVGEDHVDRGRSQHVRQITVVIRTRRGGLGWRGRVHSTKYGSHLDTVTIDPYVVNMLTDTVKIRRSKSGVPDSRRWVVLAVVCVAVFVTTLDGLIVNIALPSLATELGATTRQLQWIVDAYLLVFTGSLLAAGGLGDRFGRRRTLIIGLALFGATSAYAGSVGTPGALIGARALMGIGAAAIFPATLAIITNAFTDSRERAKAIGIWSAVSGIGVAAGPIAGGWLLEHFWWGSIFYVNIPVVVAAIIATIVIIPESKDRHTPRLDRVGLALSITSIGALVFTIIEAPEYGWLSAFTLGGFAIAIALIATFVIWELRVEHPLLPVRIFENLRFSAASVSVTSAFFALFGFVFLITQYFQLIRGYTPLQAGVRTLPVAFSIALASVVSPMLVHRIGTKLVVAGGLASMAIGFLWVSTASAATPYLEIVGQMILLGAGLGSTTAPATESIMGSLSVDKAGVGSAVNDTTRELGGTLGVAVVGSVFTSIYVSKLAAR
jgi:EmrB/QacA subfamily drug resistance transporter